MAPTAASRASRTQPRSTPDSDAVLGFHPLPLLTTHSPHRDPRRNQHRFRTATVMSAAACARPKKLIILMLSLHGGLNSPSIDVLLRYHRFPENFKPSADASWRKLTQLEYYALRVGPSRRRYMFGRRAAFVLSNVCGFHAGIMPVITAEREIVSIPVQAYVEKSSCEPMQGHDRYVGSHQQHNHQV
ncbi:hypothetical protein BGY98DRAFT_2738 [Russula aff. rugulosa BPL654]|nr:hypothetical protein BGY98DRAFT_2738 [Russula aff. rugulosa BPL654]